MKGKPKIHLVSILIVSGVMMAGCTKDQAAPVENSQYAHESSTHTESPKVNENEMLTKIVAFAKQGRIAGNDFEINQSFSEVEKKWGAPSHVDHLAIGNYVSYPSKMTTFGYNGSNIIFDIRSYNQLLHEINYMKIEQSLGKPDEYRVNMDDNIYVYHLGNSIDLKFVIPSSAGFVDHISVYDNARAHQSSPQSADGQKDGDVTDYFLSIKGNSNKLTDRAWTNMLNWRNNMLQFTKKHSKQVFLNGQNVKQVALTFDDGPDQYVTPEVVRVLNKYGVKGSFFFIGSKVEKYPDVVKMAYDQGSLILNHTFDHIDLTQLKENDVQNEIQSTESAIQKIIGKKPAILRPPYGETSDEVVQLAKENNDHIVLWSIDTLDWSQKDSANIERNVLSNVRNGDIILMHTNSSQEVTAKSVASVIENLQKRGFKLVDVATLLHIKPYK
ncbi:polysaccharide deacetylase family protein [Falsibacillus albus]|uniref:DUF4309 domain-containing protein n=1 Tax=Falsibacillus albus TaxID=2478915 RepID=A0A3L7JYZ3_9BACI|nr:polysaccharide deacetylase family protein [Falsibacillus albus]RLQ95494.1 DUF4309 domain-containing protein [Falsibacillus albus]